MGAYLLPVQGKVFIHIPKTGGRSIRDGLFKAERSLPIEGRIPKEWEQWPSLTFVRNPMDGFLSAFRYLRASQFSQIAALSVDRFLDVVEDESISPAIAGGKTWQGMIRHHAIPQTHPFNLLDHADEVGRFETFEADCLRLLGRKPPHLNASPKAPVKLTTAERARVLSVYATDFIDLDYKP